jgi:hypothetical protein
MRTWFILLSIFSCLLCPKQQCKAYTDKDVANHPIAAEVPRKDAPSPTYLKHPNPETSADKQSRPDGQPPQTDWCDLFIRAFIANWPLIIIGIIGTCAAIRTFRAFVIQIKEMNRQTIAMRISADASKESAKALINSERAWIQTELVPASVGPDPPYILRVSNYGRTPADIISHKIEFFSLDGTDKAFESNGYHENIHILLARDASKDFDGLRLSVAFTVSWNEVRSGKRGNRIEVSVAYFDIFNRDVTHSTEMVYTYNPSGGNVINLPALTKYT